ncbi:hypothetical protein DPMN_026564 [Dreissena polymorpha]|uniref:Uncharacterized protein n=1 Tax=Dreissena polymorpha TaxID=45954 RepID=A0A9D4LTN0_DREPO|nr:hypothetical protein DPMN_026564 [Dreissena polymorpha]
MAVQRALRGHLLVDKCLHSQLISEMTQEDPEIQILLDQTEELYSSILRGETTLADAACSEILMKLKTAIEKKNNEVAQTSKTNQLCMASEMHINSLNHGLPVNYLVKRLWTRV